jgi:uroporphyrinogen decarboxylase
MAARKLKIKPEPDFNRLEKVFLRQGEPDRVPFFELLSNLETQVLHALGRFDHTRRSAPGSADEENRLIRQQIDYMYLLGYDYITLYPKNFDFPRKEAPKAVTSYGEREYHTADFHTISCRRDFDTYPWPDPSALDYSNFEQAAKILPEGMKIIASFSGVLENVMWLLGYEGTSYLLYEDQQLIEDMFSAVGSRIVAYYDNVGSLDSVGALLLGDDMGFKTQTLLSPEVFRKYLFPWHRKIVQTAHRKGKPVILHACGNLGEVMEDIIACGWDARHSFEDVIEPVWEAKQKYGHRIAILGGFDMDKICRMSRREVRAHTRFLIEKCAPGGGWALGTGNSVADYVPVVKINYIIKTVYQ